MRRHLGWEPRKFLGGEDLLDEPLLQPDVDLDPSAGPQGEWEYTDVLEAALDAVAFQRTINQLNKTSGCLSKVAESGRIISIFRAQKLKSDSKC